MKNPYKYSYYVVYRSLEDFSFLRISSDWKAGAIMDLLLFFLFFPILFYYAALTGEFPEFGGPLVIVPVAFCLICVPNYFLFHYKYRWKQIVKEYSALDQGRKMINSLVAWSCIAFAVFNMIFSVYVLDLKAGENHTGPYAKEYFKKK